MQCLEMPNQASVFSDRTALLKFSLRVVNEEVHFCRYRHLKTTRVGGSFEQYFVELPRGGMLEFRLVPTSLSPLQLFIALGMEWTYEGLVYETRGCIPHDKNHMSY